MPLLKISIPVYKRDTWDSLAKQGTIEVFDCDNLPQAYEILKPQIADLLSKLHAENQIVVTLHELEIQIRDRQETLRVLSAQIVRANKQLERLKTFLQSIGINPFAGSLAIDPLIVRNLRPADAVIVDGGGEADSREF